VCPFRAAEGDEEASRKRLGSVSECVRLSGVLCADAMVTAVTSPSAISLAKAGPERKASGRSLPRQSSSTSAISMRDDVSIPLEREMTGTPGGIRCETCAGERGERGGGAHATATAAAATAAAATAARAAAARAAAARAAAARRHLCQCVACKLDGHGVKNEVGVGEGGRRVRRGADLREEVWRA